MASVEEYLTELDRNGRLQVGPCHGKIANKIDALAIPDTLKRLFTIHWPNNPDAGVGPFRIRIAGQILAPDDLKLLLPYGMVAIGDGGSGDLFVIRFADGTDEIGVVNINVRWSSAPPPTHYAKITDSLLEFFKRVSEDDDLPADYYDAIGE